MNLITTIFDLIKMNEMLIITDIDFKYNYKTRRTYTNDEFLHDLENVNNIVVSKRDNVIVDVENKEREESLLVVSTRSKHSKAKKKSKSFYKKKSYKRKYRSNTK